MTFTRARCRGGAVAPLAAAFWPPFSWPPPRPPVVLSEQPWLYFSGWMMSPSSLMTAGRVKFLQQIRRISIAGAEYVSLPDCVSKGQHLCKSIGSNVDTSDHVHFQWAQQNKALTCQSFCESTLLKSSLQFLQCRCMHQVVWFL